MGPLPGLDRSSLPAREYAYLLGVYLGDGHIVLCRRGVYRLMIACDAGYPGLVRTGLLVRPRGREARRLHRSEALRGSLQAALPWMPRNFPAAQELIPAGQVFPRGLLCRTSDRRCRRVARTLAAA